MHHTMSHSRDRAPRTTLLDVVHESDHGRGVVRRFHAPRDVVRRNQAIDLQASLLLSNLIDFAVQESPDRGTDFNKPELDARGAPLIVRMRELWEVMDAPLRHVATQRQALCRAEVSASWCSRPIVRHSRQYPAAILLCRVGNYSQLPRRRVRLDRLKNPPYRSRHLGDGTAAQAGGPR
jgi:hypothetical protein